MTSKYVAKNSLRMGVEKHTESHAYQPHHCSNLILVERMVICVGIAATRLLDGCSRGIEEATWWKYCARAVKLLLAVQKFPR